MRGVATEPLTRESFAPFGQVIDTSGAPLWINAGTTARYHDLARIELEGDDARPLISIFRGQPFTLPFTLALVERHPLGSQAFFPLSGRPFLVVVVPDNGGIPGTPRAFLTRPHQGVNIALNVWHGTLTPLEAASDFLVVDRGGGGSNLEEHRFDEPVIIHM